MEERDSEEEMEVEAEVVMSLDESEMEGSVLYC